MLSLNNTSMQRKRAPKFVPQLLLALSKTDRLSLRISDLPKSYQEQPYNLAAKLLSRGGISCKIIVNSAADQIIFIKKLK